MIGKAGEGNRAEFEGIDPMGDGEDFADFLFDDEDCGSGFAVDLGHSLKYAGDEVRRKAKRRFVKHEEFGFGDERTGYGDHLLFAAGEPSGDLLCAVLQRREDFKDLRDAGFEFLPRELKTADLKILEDGEFVKNAAALRGKGDSAKDVLGGAGTV